jgi:hypothetical protein
VNSVIAKSACNLLSDAQKLQFEAPQANLYCKANG